LPTLKEKSSPYVGFLRHSPPSNILFNTKENVASKSKKDKKDKVSEYLENAAVCTSVSGRLLGGNPTGYSSAFYDYIDHAFENAKRNKKKSSSDVSKESNDSIELLKSLGLLPTTFDDTTLCEIRDHQFVDNFKTIIENLVLPFFASFMKRILFGQGHRLGFNHSLGICEVSHWDDVFDDSACTSNSTNKSCSIHTELNENSPLFTSISSSAKAYHVEQMRQEMSESLTPSETENIRRHLDIESILKLPMITYRSDNVDNSQLETSYPEGEESTNENDCQLEWSWINVPQHEERDGGKLRDEVGPKKKKSQCHNENRKREESGNEHCIICLEPFQDGDRLRILPCNHLFHSSCIDKWLSGSFSYEECITSGCPTCKKTPFVESGELITEVGEVNLDGTVPSWAFTSLGGSLAGNTFD